MGDAMFCEKCGKILAIKNSNEKAIGFCSCGFSREINFEVGFSEKGTKKELLGEGVSKETADINEGLLHVCQKCGHDRCEFTDLGVQVGDESNIILYKCKKCNHTRRQADGSGNK